MFRAADHRRRTLIHIYSIGYMEHDPDRRRFFAYLNLFLAAMLILVLADNYLGLYLGWEGVGLRRICSSVSGSTKPSAATAAKKAFVVNRVGDIGLAVALMVMFNAFGRCRSPPSSRARPATRATVCSPASVSCCCSPRAANRRSAAAIVARRCDGGPHRCRR